ncbi:MAG TPA: FtsX-like permease family protein, partial [Actinomycetes bacterium]
MTIGQRMATESPATHEHLQPRVMAYANIMGPQSEVELAILISICLFAVMLLVLVCSNVALLLFARAATREGELVVRSALGASRRRIVMQLFAEALVLGCVAATVGLAAAGVALRTWGVEFLRVNIGRIPFWYDPRLSPATVAYALGLTVLAAVIIIQVAVTVAFPVIVFIEQREIRRIQSYDIGFAADEYLGVQLEMDAPAGYGEDAEAAAAALGARYGSALEELRRRLRAEAGVTGVTFVDRLPRMFHREGYVEIDGLEAGPALGGPATATPAEVSMARIDPWYFEVLEAPILAGRAFDTRDLAPDARVVIVDQAFVDQVLRGLNPIGQRMRFVERQRRDEEPLEPWLEIVGVVKDLGMTFAAHQHRAAGVYLPADLARSGLLNMVVHSVGDPMGLAPRIREIAAAVDPNLRLSELQRLDRVTDSLQWFLRLWLRITGLLTAIALLLSLAGIYAVLSFTVARRTREIGV